MTIEEHDKPLWGLGEVLELAWPAGVSMLNGTIMMFVDGMMVARLGPHALSAQFVGGIMAFVLTSLCLGLLTVVNTFVSQNLGAGQEKRCGQYVWAGLVIALSYSLVMQFGHFLAGPLFGAFDHAPEVQELEGIYFHYILSGMGIFLASRVLEQFIFGIGRSRIVLITSMIGNVFNVFANYTLIFGKFGFPAMGVKGAAIGTIAGASLMLLILFAVFLSSKMDERFATRNAGAMKISECLQILKIGIPAGVQLCNGVLCWGIVTGYLVGFFGTLHLAANTAAVRYLSMSFMPAVGISVATTALVGRYIGMGRFDLARKRTHVAALTAMAYMGLCGLGFWIWRYELIEFYIRYNPNTVASPEQIAQGDEIIRIGGRLMLCAAIFQIFDAIAIIFTGALRGAGDTFWPMIITMVMTWTLHTGLGVLLVKFLPQLESIGPWIAVGVYIIILSITLAWRFESGAWEKINLLGKKPIPTIIDNTLES